MEGTVENINPQDEMRRKAWFYTLVQGIISAAIGLILILFPSIGMVFISVVFGLILIWMGLTQIILGFKLSSYRDQWVVIMVRGTVLLISGIIVLIFPMSFARLGTGIPLVLTGLVLMFFGIHDLISRGTPGSGLPHIFSDIILIVTGALLCFAPVASAIVIFRILGFTTIAGGALNISRALWSRRWASVHLENNENQE
jgi:uncharacterized membrane protein HdeD (DUF308 family)